MALGRKGASGRGPHGRIEEHGFHVWMGCYENAFRLMRECYRELGRDPRSCRIADWRDAFFPAPFLTVAAPRQDGSYSRRMALELAGAALHEFALLSPRASNGRVDRALGGGGSLDYTTGIISGGGAGNATFQFDVPVRFDIDKLEVEIQDFATDEFASIVRKIPLIEVRV